MTTHLLSKTEFLATSKRPMLPTDPKDGEAMDVWGYALAVLAAEHPSVTYDDVSVTNVYRSGDGRYEHVMFNWGKDNFYLVLVFDRTAKRIYGHHLLDLNAEYGLS